MHTSSTLSGGTDRSLYPMLSYDVALQALMDHEWHLHPALDHFNSREKIRALDGPRQLEQLFQRFKGKCECFRNISVTVKYYHHIYFHRYSLLTSFHFYSLSFLGVGKLTTTGLS